VQVHAPHTCPPLLSLPPINYTLAATGNVGIGNISPWAPLNIVSVDSVSDVYESFSKNTGISYQDLFVKVSCCISYS
jgi:hypothetical protein